MRLFRSATTSVLLVVHRGSLALLCRSVGPRPRGPRAAPAATIDAPLTAEPLAYDWRAQWYPAGFVVDVPAPPEPMAFSIFDEQLVLWRDSRDGIRCVEDRCPHRLAALSQGAVEPDGSLRCFYHGWQFDGATGQCSKIPQLAEGASIPRTARARTYPTFVREGIAWVWLVPDGLPTRDPPATVDDLDARRKDFQIYDYAIDLPYDHTWLVENLADPAHIPISHDRTEGGGRRELAEAYDMEIHETTSDGFVGRYKGANKTSWTEARFEAPGIIRYRTTRPATPSKPEMVFGAALHCVPRGRGLSRLLFRTYFTKKSVPRAALWLLSLKPQWLRNLNSCKVLEQDVGLITSQEDAIRRTHRPLATDCLPLKSTDGFVVAYRKWLDRVSAAWPHVPVGWTVAPSSSDESGVSGEAPGFPHVSHPSHRSRLSRIHNHVAISSASRGALRNVVRARDAALVAFALSTVATAAASTATLPLACAALASAAVAGGAAKLERCFYRNFDRHKWRP